MPPLCGMVAVKSIKKNNNKKTKNQQQQQQKTQLNSLHRRAAKLILSDPSIPTNDKLKTQTSPVNETTKIE